ncbi:MAG: dehypoxanthine futalosine cyclase [Acidobacteriaceae bacterium]
MGMTREQALQYFASDDLIGIGMEADALRRKLHPEGVVTYLIDHAVVCLVDSAVGIEAALANASKAVRLGAASILLQASSPLSLESLESLLASLRQSFPQLRLHGLSATDVVKMAQRSNLSVPAVLQRLQNAGLDALDGDDAAILDDEIRQKAAQPLCNAEEWLSTHRSAHTLGLPSAASMTFGLGESTEQRIAHLEQIRALQEETSGFTAFTPRNLQLNPALGQRKLDEATAVEYLKVLAISRLYLENIENMETGWTVQGPKVLQMALRFGCNDVGSVVPQENTAETDGQTEEDMRRILRDAGFKPVQRDTTYRAMFLA